MKNILMLLILCLILASCNGRKESQYVVSGTMKGVDTGMIYLQKMDSVSWVNVDSAVLKKSEFDLIVNQELCMLYVCFSSVQRQKCLLIYYTISLC